MGRTACELPDALSPRGAAPPGRQLGVQRLRLRHAWRGRRRCSPVVTRWGAPHGGSAALHGNTAACNRRCVLPPAGAPPHAALQACAAAQPSTPCRCCRSLSMSWRRRWPAATACHPRQQAPQTCPHWLRCAAGTAAAAAAAGHPWMAPRCRRASTAQAAASEAPPAAQPPAAWGFPGCSANSTRRASTLPLS